MKNHTAYGLESDCTHNSLSNTSEKDNNSSECTSETLESKLRDLLSALHCNGSDNWMGKPHTTPLEELMTGPASSFHDPPFSSNKESAERKFPVVYHGSPKVPTGGSGAVETAKPDEKNVSTVVQKSDVSLEDLMELYISNLRQLRQVDFHHCHDDLATDDMRPSTSDNKENATDLPISECWSIKPNRIATEGNRPEMKSSVCSHEESVNSVLNSGCKKDGADLSDLADLATSLAEVLSETTFSKLGTVSQYSSKMTRSRVKREREKTTEAKQKKRCEHFLRPSAKEENNSTVFQNSSSYPHRTQRQISLSSDKESRDRVKDSSSSLTRDAASFLSSSSFSSAISGGFSASNNAESTAPVLLFNNGCSSHSSTDGCYSTLSSPCLPSLVKPAIEEWKPNQLRRGVLLEKTVNSKTAGTKEDTGEKKEEECYFKDKKEGDSMTLGDLLGFSLTQKSRKSTPTTVNVAMERERLCTPTGGGSDVISCSSFPFSAPLLPCSSPTALWSNRFSSRSDTNGNRNRNSTSCRAVNHVGRSPTGCHPTEKKIETEMAEENARIENESEKKEKGGTTTGARPTTDTCGVSPSLSVSVSPLTSKVLVQSQLDFGQKDATRLGVWCPYCQLLYSPHQEEDTKLHRRVCSFAGSGRQRKQRQADKNGGKRSVLSEADFRDGSSLVRANTEKKVDRRTSCAANSPTVGLVLSAALDPDTTTSVVSSSTYRYPSNSYDDNDKEEKEVNRGIHRLRCSSSSTVRKEGSRTHFHSRAVSEAAERAAAALLSLAFQAASPTASIPFGSASASLGFQSVKKKMSPFHSASSSSSSDFLFSVHLERQEVLLDPHTTSSFSSPLIVFLISVRYYGWGVMWEKAPELAEALEDLRAVKTDDGGASSFFFHAAPTTRGTICEDIKENSQDSVQKKGHLRRSSTVAYKGVNACQDRGAQERSKLEMQMVKEEPATRKIHGEESVLVCGVAIREGSAMKDDFSSSAFYAPNGSCSLFSSSLTTTRATSNNATNRSSTTTTACSNILDGDGERSLPILLCAVFGKAHTREQEPQFESDPATQKCVLRRQCTLADVEHIWILPIPYWPPSPALPSLPSFDFIISPSNFIPRPKEKRKTEDERDRMSAFLLVIRCWCQNVIYGASLCCRSQLSYAAHFFRNTPKPLTLHEEETHVESFLRTWWSDEERKKNLIRGYKICCTDDTEKELDDWIPFVHNDDGDDALAED